MISIMKLIYCVIVIALEVIGSADLSVPISSQRDLCFHKGVAICQ